MRKFNYKKREQGDGAGVSYAMMWFTIMVCFVFFVLVQFNSKLYVAKAEMVTGTHIIEGSTMTKAQSFYDATLNNPLFSSDMQKAHIVTSDINVIKTETGKREQFISTSTIGTVQIAQLEKIGNFLTASLKHQFNLTDNNVPQSGCLYALSAGRKEGTKLLIKNVVIYEPCYEYIITKIKTDDDSYTFTQSGKIIAWKKYTLNYDDNNKYKNTSVITLSTTPTLQNGNKCEGATIEMTIGTTFYGINRLFAEASQASGHQYNVLITESTDIVLTTLDSRDVNYIP